MRSAGPPFPLFALAALALPALGCGSSPTARDEVFYLHATSVAVERRTTWEVSFKPLDRPASERVPRVVGVGVMGSDVRMGRPIDWTVRAADYTPARRFISYQSPRQFLFSIYERIDSPGDRWTDVLRRYEADVEEQGSQIVAARMPVATANTQGRSYLLRTRVPAKPDFQSYAHEILIRGDHRVLLVQIIHGESIEAIAPEVVAVLSSMTVY
jgi:hypothetical protein